MNKYIAGIIAGFIATIVMSLLLMFKSMMGLMPDFDIIAMIASKMGGSKAIALVAHFMIGSIGYGIGIALASGNNLHRNFVGLGIGIGFVGWLVMMVAVMPIMGKAMFGLDMPSGVMIPIATLMLHIVFGVVLGKAYTKLVHK
ncbi:DUF6789 family protein [Psychrobacter sp. TB55-MNA-CIBAN-0194]|uniref:DUF6789 family protein n=1 Tax=Psychrobacter sp. TB55-MNA-CIBAN-0194 TaxID=3140445 RepID=UPI00331B3014